MKNNCPINQGLAEFTPHLLDKHKKVRDGAPGEGQGLLEEVGFQINKDHDDGRIEEEQDMVHPQAALQRLQQQPQGSLVRWERFLPIRSVEVLLVENDDSTRQVVSQLLGNCGYGVTAVENGLEAWKILEDLTTHIDLVLSEADLPFLSGIGLLSKINSHETHKNIPFIMMSSSDSMDIAFKCLSKGAADFLAKPIRRSELKNLWQHIWRKCQSACENRGESGTSAKKSPMLKSGKDSEKSTGSNHDDDIGTISSNVANGSDSVAGTQSSSTTRTKEVDGWQPMPQRKQLADPARSTCPQLIHSRGKAFGNNLVPMTMTREQEEQDNETGSTISFQQLHNVFTGKDVEFGVSRTPLQLEDPSTKGFTYIAGTDGEKIPEMRSKGDGEKLQKGQLELDSVKRNGDLRNKVADPMGVTTKNTDPQTDGVVSEIPSFICKASDIEAKDVFDNKEAPCFNRSLKRLRDVGDTGAQKRKILVHSELSAFSKYNSASMANRVPTKNKGSCSPLDNATEAVRTESAQNFLCNSNGICSTQGASGSNDNNDMGTTASNAFAKGAFSDRPVPKYTDKRVSPSAFRPVEGGHISRPLPIVQGKTHAAITSTYLAKERQVNQQVQVQHHHHHYDHHHHHTQNMMATAPHSGLSSLLSKTPEGNVSNHSSNRSQTGSNRGSNRQPGSSTGINAGGTVTKSVNTIAGKVEASDVTGFASMRRDDANISAHREAALNKFRQKRKERCFEKKVRYHNRKKLA